MQVGLTVMLTDRGIRPDELARAAEERGFSSLFLPEHTHMPVRRSVVHPTLDRLPDAYARTWDPFVALTAAAAATDRLQVGTGVALLSVRDPIITAKAVASLDHLSGGRFILGVGYGWNVEELGHHGTQFRDRRQIALDRLACMRALWRDEVASHDGTHVQLAPSRAWPKPLAGSVPVWLGVGAGDRALGEVARHADVWAPHGGSGLRDALPRLARACEHIGRDPAEVGVVPFGSVVTPGKLDHFQRLGCPEVVALLPDDQRDAVLTELDRLAATVASWRGAAA